MKKKIFAILIALALVASFSLIPAIPAMAATLNVGTGQTYANIQAAIDAASPGDTIKVEPGTYTGNIKIDKSLTIIGDPGDGSPGPGTNAPVIDGNNQPDSAFFIENGVSGVTIEGFKMENFASNDPGVGNGIQAWVASTSNITITHNYFYNLGWDAVLVGNDGSLGDHTNWIISNNIVENCAAYGLELTNASNSVIENNVITLKNSWTGILTVARRNENDITISGNTITGTLDTSSNGARAAIYVLAWVDSDQTAITSVTFDSVSISDNSISVTSTENLPYIRVNEVTNITGGTASAKNVSVHFNNLAGAGDLALQNQTASPIDATNNWWGTTDSSTIATLYSGSVNYEPFLQSPYTTETQITGNLTAQLSLTLNPSGTPTAKIVKSPDLVQENAWGVPDSNDDVTAAVAGLTPFQVTLSNTGNAVSDNVGIQTNSMSFTAGNQANIQLWAKDESSGNWYDIVRSGFGASGGISLPAGQSYGVDVYAISNVAGTYTGTGTLYDFTTSQNTDVNATITIQVDPVEISITAPSAINFNFSNVGGFNYDSSTGGVVNSNSTSFAWTMTASGKPYMATGSGNGTKPGPGNGDLKYPLLISPTGSPWYVADGSTQTIPSGGTEYSGTYNISGTSTKNFVLHAAQYIDPTDTAGDYSDTITFSISYTP